ncbi:MAG: hypothetical protein JWM39_320 [Parcubacteria group bacterium]|jgi:signal transduction histidine kinase|nr:hypothetical protein [Parcubacteria group bacterium]
MDSFINLDLLWVGIAVAGAGTLGCSIFFSEHNSATARAFLFFTMVSIGWSIVNFLSGRATDPAQILWLIRLVLFFASWHAFSFLLLADQFPARERRRHRRTLLAGFILTAVVSVLTLTPFVFRSVVATLPAVQTQTGPDIALFGLVVFGYVGAGITALVRKFLRARGAERRQFESVLFGMVLTFIFLVTFDFVFPAFLNVPTLVPLGGLFLLPFIAGTAYAILEYRLFNIRVAIFGLLTFLLAIATFTDVLFSTTLLQMLYRTGELVLVMAAGVWLIRSMVREVEQREKIQLLANDLEKANEQQIVLIHFITHQIKGFLTKSRNIFASMQEGDFGAIPESLTPFVEEGLRSDTKAVQTIQEILNAANIKSGKVTYMSVPFDLKEVADEILTDLKPAADTKGLVLTLATEGDSFTMSGDRMQMVNALKNLIDNSIKYTPSGSVAVSLSKQEGKIRFEIKDTGVGITAEDMTHLFTEGGHGKESQKINVDSTGFGLFIVKNIIEAHHGRVWAESEGAGKGSQFIVELPA